MSSIPGRTMESFVEDCLMRPSPERVRRICEVLEPVRGNIENSLDSYDSEEQSWRDYRNGLWDMIMETHPDFENRIDAILEELKDQPEGWLR